MKALLTFTGICIMASVLGVALLIIGIVHDENERFSEETFHAWEHANPTFHLSKDEWERLVRNNMLPVQNQYTPQ